MVMKSKSDKSTWLVLVSVVVTAVIVGSGVYAWQRSIFPVTKPFTASKDLSQFSDESEGWKTYTNTSLGFELMIPAYVSITDYTDQYNQQVFFKSSKENFEVVIKSNKDLSLEGEYHYLDMPVSSKSMLGGKEALVFESSTGYCDGPSCTDPFIAYSTKEGDDFYNLVFMGDTVLSYTEKSILSSFKLTK